MTNAIEKRCNTRLVQGRTGRVSILPFMSLTLASILLTILLTTVGTPIILVSGAAVPGAPVPDTCSCQPRATLSIWIFGHGDPANSPGWARLKAGFLEGAKSMRVQTQIFFLTTKQLRAIGGDPAKGVADLLTQQLLTNNVTPPEGILLSIPSSPQISAVLDAVRVKFPGIQIASYGDGSNFAESIDSLFHIGQDDSLAGHDAGVRLAQTGASSAICVYDSFISEMQATRCEAFKTAFKASCVASPCTVNTTFIDSSDAQFASTFLGTLQKNGAKADIGLLSVSPTLLPLLYSPISSLGSSSPITSLASFDVTPFAMQHLSPSNNSISLSFIVDQQEYSQGYLGVVLLTYFITTGQKVANSFIQTGPKLVFTEKTFVPPALAQVHLDTIVHGLNSDTFWGVFHEGVEMAARDLGMVFTDCTDPNSQCDFTTSRKLSKPSVYYSAPANSFDLVTMSHLIDVAVGAMPQGIAVSLPSVTELQSSITSGVHTGIPFVSLNSGYESAAALGMLEHVGQDEYLAGQAMGEYFASMNITTCLCANQEPSNSALILRCQGVHDAMKAANPAASCTAVPTSDDGATATHLLTQAIQAASVHPGALVVAGGGAVASVISAGQSTGLIPSTYSTATPKCYIGSFDWLTSTQEAMLANQVQIIIHQQQHAQGYIPIQLLYLHALTNNIPLTPVLLSGPAVILPSNMGVFNCLDAPLCADPEAHSSSNSTLSCPRPDWVADGWCDTINNIAGCYDGGDCCMSTCGLSSLGATISTTYTCNKDYFSTGRNSASDATCRDPEAVENYCVTNPKASRCAKDGDLLPVSANMTESQRTGWTVVAAISLALVIAFAAGLVLLRNQFVFVSASVPFLLALLVGAALLLIGAILVAMPQTTAICQAKVWISHLGLDLMIGTLLVKTARLHFIFNQANLAKLNSTNLSNFTLFSALGLVCLVDVVILAAWSGASPLTADEFTSACYSDDETPFTAVMLAYKGVLIAASLIYVYRCKNIPASFNETEYLVAAFYNLSFVGWLLVVVILALGSSIADSTQSAIKAFGLIYGALTTSSILLAPKFNSFRKSDAAFTINPSVMGSVFGQSVAGTSVLSSSLDSLSKPGDRKSKDSSLDVTDPSRSVHIDHANKILKQQLQNKTRLSALTMQIKSETARLAQLNEDVKKLQIQLLKEQTELNYIEEQHGVKPQHSIVDKSLREEQNATLQQSARGSLSPRATTTTTPKPGMSHTSSIRQSLTGTNNRNSTASAVIPVPASSVPSVVIASPSGSTTVSDAPVHIHSVALDITDVPAAASSPSPAAPTPAVAAASSSPPRRALRVHLAANSPTHYGDVFQQGTSATATVQQT